MKEVYEPLQVHILELRPMESIAASDHDNGNLDFDDLPDFPFNRASREE